MRSRRQDAWNQDDTVEVLVTEDVRDDDEDVRETARRIVNDSRAMARFGALSKSEVSIRSGYNSSPSSAR